MRVPGVMLHHSSKFIKATVPQNSQYYDIDGTKFRSSSRHVTIIVLRERSTIQHTISISITVGITQLTLNSVGTAVQIRGRKSSERLPSIPPNHAPNTELPPGKWVNP